MILGISAENNIPNADLDRQEDLDVELDLPQSDHASNTRLKRSFSYEKGQDEISFKNVFENKRKTLPTSSQNGPALPDGFPSNTPIVLPTKPRQPNKVFYRTIQAYPGLSEGHLSLDNDEIVMIMHKSDNGWWYGKTMGRAGCGWLPSSCLDKSSPDPPVSTAIAVLQRQAKVHRGKARRQAIYINDKGIANLECGKARRDSFHGIATPLRECAGCGDTKGPSEFSPADALQCSHSWQTCFECIKNWVMAELNSKAWDEIRCLEKECAQKLCYRDIFRLVDNDTFQRYDTMATRALLSATSDFRWCVSPHCNSGQIHDSGNVSPILTCAACGFQTCIVHSRPWHRGETCAQYDYRISGQAHRDKERREREEQATARKLAETTKRCPGQNCGWNIEKNAACDHMTCSKCRHEFCWACLAPYDPIRKEGNSRHRSSCKYHTSNVR